MFEQSGPPRPVVRWWDRALATRTTRRVMSGVLAAVVVGASGLLAGSASAMPVDVPPPPPLPGVGGKFTDPTFGTSIMRITAGGGSHAYSYWPTFNKDSTKLYVQSTPDGPQVYDFDPVNFQLGARQTVFEDGECSAEDAIWSGVSPTVMLCHDTDGVIRSYDVVTHQSTVIKTLPLAHTWQLSRSVDDQVFALTARDEDYQNIGWIVYDRRTDTITRFDTDNVDEVQLDKTGRYLVHKTNSQGVGEIEVIVVDLLTGERTPLTDNEPDYAPGHSDNGSGLVYGNDNWENRVLKRNLATPHEFVPLLTWPNFEQDNHISALADSDAWILVSAYGARTGPLAGEIFQVATDGSGEMRHLVHHQSVGDENNVFQYDHIPRATISRDGRFVTFASNWGVSAGPGDVFVAMI